MIQNLEIWFEWVTWNNSFKIEVNTFVKTIIRDNICVKRSNLQIEWKVTCISMNNKMFEVKMIKTFKHRLHYKKNYVNLVCEQ